MSRIITLLIKTYQYSVSPFLGQCCRFHPSCSHYASEAISRHGVTKGMFLSAKRIIRCNPWNAGGYDPVP